MTYGDGEENQSRNYFYLTAHGGSGIATFRDSADGSDCKGRYATPFTKLTHQMKLSSEILISANIKFKNEQHYFLLRIPSIVFAQMPKLDNVHVPPRL